MLQLAPSVKFVLLLLMPTRFELRLIMSLHASISSRLRSWSSGGGTALRG